MINITEYAGLTDYIDSERKFRTERQSMVENLYQAITEKLAPTAEMHAYTDLFIAKACTFSVADSRPGWRML